MMYYRNCYDSMFFVGCVVIAVYLIYLVPCNHE